MNVLELIQAEGPADHTKAGYDKWYNKILLAANGILKIEGVLDTEELAETVGDYSPLTKKWTGGKHEKFVDLTEER